MQLVRANPRRERVLLFRRGTGPRTIAGDGAIGLEVILPGFR